jgi:hypothetical protein
LKKVTWSLKASKELNNVYDYWESRNGSSLYSEKIIDETFRIIYLLRLQNFIGEESRFRKIRRVLILENFSLFYKVIDDEIKILSFFDNRRNPANINLQ